MSKYLTNLTSADIFLCTELRAEGPILRQQIAAHQGGGSGGGQQQGQNTGQTAAQVVAPQIQAFEIEGAPGPVQNQACASNRDCGAGSVCLATTRSAITDLSNALIAVLLGCVARGAVDTNKNGGSGPNGLGG